MFKCEICGNTTAKESLTSEIFNVEGRRVLVERIPALICERCGEATYSRDTTERIRRLVHGSGEPVRRDALDVFALA